MLTAALTPNIIATLDIGSTHTTAAIAQIQTQSDTPTEPNRNERIQLLGVTRVLNSGCRRGGIINFDAAVVSIQNAIDEVERQSGVNVVAVRLSTAHAQAISANLTETLPLRNQEVRPSDVARVVSAIHSRKVESTSEIINTIAAGFVLDGKSGLINPVGMYGLELGAVFHRVTCPAGELRNHFKAVNTAGLRIDSVAFQPLAAAESVLSPDEKEYGVACLNLGHEMIHLAVYYAGVPVYSRTYPIGSHHITKDLAIGLRSTQADAEQVKRNIGQAFPSQENAHEIVHIGTLDSGGQRTVTKGEIWQIIEARVQEILNTAVGDLKNQKLLAHLNKGVVITGGGSLLPGICLASESTFHLAARIGFPMGVTGLDESSRTPAATTTLGLLSPVFARNHLSAFHPPTRGFRRWSRNIWNLVTEPFLT